MNKPIRLGLWLNAELVKPSPSRMGILVDDPVLTDRDTDVVAAILDAIATVLMHSQMEEAIGMVMKGVEAGVGKQNAQSSLRKAVLTAELLQKVTSTGKTQTVDPGIMTMGTSKRAQLTEAEIAAGANALRRR